MMGRISEIIGGAIGVYIVVLIFFMVLYFFMGKFLFFLAFLFTIILEVWFIKDTIKESKSTHQPYTVDILIGIFIIVILGLSSWYLPYGYATFVWAAVITFVMVMGEIGAGKP